MRPFASLPVAQVAALLVLVLAAVVASAGCECVFVLPDGGTRIESAAVTATPIFFLPKSMGCAPFAVMNQVPRHGETPFGIRSLLDDHRQVFEGSTSYRSDGNGEVVVRHRLVCVAETEAMGLYATFPLAAGDYAGGGIVFDGHERVDLPVERGRLKGGLHRAKRAVALGPDGHERFSVRFDSPQDFEVNDSRSWGGPGYVFRVPAIRRNRFRAGETNEIAYTLSTPRGLDVRTGPVRLVAGREWVPLVRFSPFVAANSALDWTHLRPTGEPAGKDGRLRCVGQNFEFERRPGERVRFYGVNICGDMCWALTDDECDEFAANLARIGYNSLRIHHHDGGLATGPDRTELNAARMRRLDRLVKACIDRGLYLTTDLYVSRSLTYRQLGLDRNGRPPYESIKPLFYIWEPAFSNFLAFARNFLSHVNPHTGCRYADEPAMPLISLVNEGSIGMDAMSGVKDNPELFRPAFERWLAARAERDPAYRGIRVDPFPGEIFNGRSPETQALLLFCGELEYRFNARVTRFLREELRAKSLLTDMNIDYDPACYERVRNEFHDYVDMHFYVDHPRFPEKAWPLPSYRLNVSCLSDYRVGPKTRAMMRHLDKPFCVTEFNFCGPARLRAQGGLAVGAVAGVQNWAGVWRFGWSHHASRHRNWAKESMGGFDLVTDPLKIAEDRAGLALFGFGQLPEATETTAIVLPRDRLTRFDRKGARFIDRIDLAFLPYLRKIGLAVDDEAPPGAETLGDYDTPFFRFGRADTRRRWYPDGIVRGPHLELDTNAGALAVNTPLTAGGFAEKGEIRAGPFAARLSGGPAAVWASAIDLRPLTTSRRIVVFHLTELQNSESLFADIALCYLLERGHLPYLVRAGTAALELAVGDGDWTVHALDSSGRRVRTVTSSCVDGKLRFLADVSADPTNATFVYEAVAGEKSR